jgi:hypothetical protein
MTAIEIIEKYIKGVNQHRDNVKNRLEEVEKSEFPLFEDGFIVSENSLIRRINSYSYTIDVLTLIKNELENEIKEQE